jgi:excisionase family DNA binding protein
MSGGARQKLTPPQIAARLGVSPDKVLAWIKSRELRAFNAATRPYGRPRWLVDEADLADFERRRSAVPTSAPSRQRKQSDIIQFF